MWNILEVVSHLFQIFYPVELSCTIARETLFVFREEFHLRTWRVCIRLADRCYSSVARTLALCKSRGKKRQDGKLTINVKSKLACFEGQKVFHIFTWFITAGKIFHMTWRLQSDYDIKSFLCTDLWGGLPPRFFTTYEWIIYSHNNLRAAAAYQKAYSKTLCGRQLSSECFTLPSLMASKTTHYGGELIPFLEREEMVGLRMVFTPGSHSFLFFF